MSFVLLLLLLVLFGGDVLAARGSTSTQLREKVELKAGASTGGRVVVRGFLGLQHGPAAGIVEVVEIGGGDVIGVTGASVVQRCRLRECL